MSRARIDSLLASFPKVIPTNTQHTSVETADVRYVYQPLEDLYILLITNKASNILQDIETLHLFARVVSDMCRSADQREILKNSFDILEAFDEIVSLGYRESVNLMQVRNILEMESHEEKIQEIIARVRGRWPTPCSVLIAAMGSRTRRPRQRKSSSAARSSSRCNGENSNDVPRRGGRAETATSVGASRATPPCPRGTTRRRPCAPRRQHHQRSGHRNSRAVA